MPGRRKRVAFVTIGQSPRDDMVPEMLAQIGDGIEPVEFGLLDGLSRDEITRLEPTADDYRLVSLLHDGSEVVIAKAWAARRLQEVIDEIDGKGFDLIVLLCTGSFPLVRSRTLLVEAGRVVDHLIDALSEDGRVVGMMLPNARQVGAFERSSNGHAPIVASHASPYTDRRFADAVRELDQADLIVMHCMGYDLAMKAEVSRLSGKPVLLSRGVVAAAVQQLL
ncbi:MAG: AroM family protein [Geminicoccaceae bacterium]